MSEMFIPKSNTTDTNFGTSPETNKYLEKVITPSNMNPEDEKRLQQDILQRVIYKEAELERKIDNYKSKVDYYKKILDKQGSKNIEIIGIFSAILALLIIDVNIVKSATNFLSAILLIVSMATVLIIFAMIIHVLFSPEGKRRLFKWSLLLPVLILVTFIIIGIIAEVFKWPWSY